MGVQGNPRALLTTHEGADMMVTIIANIIAVVVVVVIMLLLEVQQRRRQARLIAELRTMANRSAGIITDPMDI